MKFLKKLFNTISSKQITQTLLNLLILLAIMLILDTTKDVWGNALSVIWAVIKPFFIAFVIAFVVNPLINWIQKYVKNRGLAVGFVYVGGLACIVLLISLAVPMIYNSLLEMYPSFESGLKDISHFIKVNFNYDVSSMIVYIETMASDMLKETTFINTTFDFLNQALINITNYLIYLILAIYMSSTYDNIKKSIKSLAKKFEPSLPTYISEVNISLINYVKAFAIGAVAQGITTSIMYLIIGHQNWLLLGIFSAISSIIPYVGPICANVLGIITSLVLGPTKLAFLLILIFIQSTIMSYVIQPKIYSSQIDLSIMWVLFGILSGSTIFGVWGMIIAMPILVTIKIIYRIYMQHHQIIID